MQIEMSELSELLRNINGIGNAATKQSSNNEKWKFLVGQKVFIRTVTYHSVGLVESVIDGVVKLSSASWVADSGRFHDVIVKGVPFSEVEPVGEMFVNSDTVVDLFVYKFELPTQQK